jgi:putative cardiolipin synthase
MKFIILCLFLLTSFGSFAGLQSATIPRPFFVEQESEDNQMFLLSRGEEALEARLDLISKATKTIEVEYYIYDADKVGKLMTLELIKAAKRGVKVRMLLDKFTSIAQVNAFFAREIMKSGIEIKYYNDSSFIQISSVQFRNHRKLLVVDDFAAITGGRNIGDHYFNQAHDINYDDRDVLITGPIVPAMRNTFDIYYDDKVSVNPKIPKPPKATYHDDERSHENKIKKYLAKVDEAKAFLVETESDIALRNEIRNFGNKQMEGKKSHVCPNTTFASDAPGAKFGDRIKSSYMDDFRFVRKAFADKVSAVDKRLIISSPYFIANNAYKEMLDSLLEKNVEVIFHTNSLASSDAIFMSANLYWHAKSWIKKGLKLFLHDGKQVEAEGMIGGTTPKIWGTHAKTHIYETSEYTEVMIGSSNFDNRSDFYNTEIAVFCKGNDEFSDEVKADVMKRMKNGISVDGNAKAITRTGESINLTGATKDKILKMQIFSVPSKLIDFLL